MTNVVENQEVNMEYSECSLTFVSELGPWITCESFSTVLHLSWTAALSNENLQPRRQTWRWKLIRKSIFDYFRMIFWNRLSILTTGGSLLSVRPSDILLSEPQEVGEWSRFWAAKPWRNVIESKHQIKLQLKSQVNNLYGVKSGSA